MKILFVGLSNKPNTKPFDSSTNSGKVVDKITSKLDHQIYKCNLVNFAPIDDNGKLRYPTKNEIADSMDEFVKHTDQIEPDLIIAFGKIVSRNLSKIENFKNRTIHALHPSYVYIYKRKTLDSYIENICYQVQDYENNCV